MDDSELLREYALRGSEPAFTELVQRHVHLVFSAARRQVASPHVAEDVTQEVFLLLARKARAVCLDRSVSGWLYRATRFVARGHRRAEQRRVLREQKAMSKFGENSSAESVWAAVAPVLDDAMSGLGEQDRRAVLMRFFEKKSFREIGSAFAISDDTAQKRVSRALEKLRRLLARRGVAVPALVLAACLSAFAVQAAPAGLAVACASQVATAPAAGGLVVAFESVKVLLATSLVTKLGVALVFVLTMGSLAFVAIKPSARSSETSWTLADPANALLRECDFIVDCSFTEHARNARNVSPASDAYGILNANRIGRRGPEFASGEEASVSAIGLMAGARVLHQLGRDTSAYDAVLKAFFETAILERNQLFETNAANPNYGGVFERVYYTADGMLDPTKAPRPPTAAHTGKMLSAMWKYAEYLRATGREAEARRWLTQARPLAERAGTFLARMFDAQWKLLRRNATDDAEWTDPAAGIDRDTLKEIALGERGGLTDRSVRSRQAPTPSTQTVPGAGGAIPATADLWIDGAAYGCAGLRCLERWLSEVAGARLNEVAEAQPSFDWATLTKQLAEGMAAMKSQGPFVAFFRFRDSRGGFAPSFGVAIDERCHAPYSADALDPAEPFCRQLSDWWTQGGGGVQMTWLDSAPDHWRHFGQRWHWYFDGRAANQRLYPGNGLQMARVEWKHGRATGDRAMLDRAQRRLEWAAARSRCWYGQTGETEAGVPNGLVGYRDALTSKPDTSWARFAPNSAYFIQVVLMVYFDIDTKYTPDDARVNLAALQQFRAQQEAQRQAENPTRPPGAEVQPDPTTSWAEEALQREADFIVNCSFTEHTINYATYPLAHPDLDAYGAINYDRVAGWGADWVVTGDSAMATVGLMAASKQLHTLGHDVSTYDQVLSKFFTIWLLARNQGVNTNADQSDAGAMYRSVAYDRKTGRWTRNYPVSTLATGKMLAAMWKFYEYNVAMNRQEAATSWLQQSWPMAREAGNYLQRVCHPQYRLARESPATNDLGLAETVWTTVALRCLSQWSAALRQPPALDYGRLADDLVGGIQELRDPAGLTNFFRLRDGEQGFAPSYGNAIETACFLPYAADVLDTGEPFCRAISDWWTHGSGGVQMTVLSADTNDWRYFGTFVRAYLDGRQDPRLGARAALELARMEWKHWHRTGDTTTHDRARQRLEWVANSAYGALWYGATGQREQNVPNGVLDWRHAQNYDRTPPAWSRFCDVSAYFIGAVLMIHFDTDMPFVPESNLHRLDAQPASRQTAGIPAGQQSFQVTDGSWNHMKRTALRFVLFVSVPSLVLAGAVLAWLAIRSRRGAKAAGDLVDQPPASPDISGRRGSHLKKLAWFASVGLGLIAILVVWQAWPRRMPQSPSTSEAIPAPQPKPSAIPAVDGRMARLIPGLEGVEPGYSPCLTPDLRTIVYAARPDLTTAYDLYIATREDVSRPFGTPKLIRSCQSPQADACPTLSPDGLELVFARGDRAPEFFWSARETPDGEFGPAELWPVPDYDPERQRIDWPQFIDRTHVAFCFTELKGYARAMLVAERSDPKSAFGPPRKMPKSTVSWPPGFLAASGLRAYYGTTKGVFYAERGNTSEPFGEPVSLLHASVTGPIDGPLWVAPQEDVIFYCSAGPGQSPKLGDRNKGRKLWMIRL